MKKLLFAFTLFVTSLGVAQNSYQYDVFYEVKAENTEKFIKQTFNSLNASIKFCKIQLKISLNVLGLF